MRNFASFWRGIKAMRCPPWHYCTVRLCREMGFWAIYWTPAWHEERGPYISVGLGILAFYRGY
jgi:hypothetical protein